MLIVVSVRPAIVPLVPRPARLRDIPQRRRRHSSVAHPAYQSRPSTLPAVFTRPVGRLTHGMSKLELHRL